MGIHEDEEYNVCLLVFSTDDPKTTHPPRFGFSGPWLLVLGLVRRHFLPCF